MPVDALGTAFNEALGAGHVVVSAATGSGKSTRLPVWAMDLGPVLVVEPRRLAATSLAGYVARQCGTETGETVGYAVRLDARYRHDTGIVYATPGIALRWLAGDGLSRFATIILDEFHERRWDTDLLLALLHRRGAHRLVLTSATIEASPLAAYLGAEELSSEGRLHPVEVRYLADEPRAMPARRGLEEGVAGAVNRALDETEGDVLVFLPGRGEIEACRARLGDCPAEVVVLHASAPLVEQRRALNPGERRRVVLATNVAETSLTVPGVTAVVDSGLERRTGRRNGRTVLALQAVARSSADQRMGRAGRVRPGLCLRLWGHAAPLTEMTPPEVQREDLTDLALAAACAGVPVSGLVFPDPLPERPLEQALSLLRRIGAVDAGGHATDRGRRLFALPVDPVMAHLVVAMPDAASAAFMADLVAALAVGGRWARPAGDEAQLHRLDEWLGRRCDASMLVAALRYDDVPGIRVEPRGRDEARRLAGQLRQLLDLPALAADWPAEVGRIMGYAAEAFPGMVYLRREKRRQAMGNGADEVLIGEESRLAEDVEAALVFADHSIPGRGRKQTLTVAGCLAPLSLRTLVDAGLCHTVHDNPRREDNALVADRQWVYAGRVISAETVPVEGEAARWAAARLILADRLLRPAGERLRDDLAAWSLYVALGHAEGAVPEPEDWLTRRLGELGVESGEDLALIEPEDLRFEGIPQWERSRFDERYPREVNLPDLRLRIHYDVRRKEVVAEKVEGIRKRDPQRWELPAWTGWRVKYRKASRVVEVR
ncbi:ATP-dependent RNA helicase [Ectothiorhodospiraceae bacterium WFHF3C12]|nr:ATP-dependent RNA helicase [Ectothiorhodospiraceae bacterium WFHF3C12]